MLATMSKRKLSRQQAWRVEKIQEERAKRAAKELCRLASFSVVDDACECVRGLSRAGSWRCTAKGAYVCASSR